MKPTSQHSAFRDLTRGGQITLHALHMFGQVLRKTLGFALFFLVLSFLSLASCKLERMDWYMMYHSLEVRLKIQAMGKAVRHRIRVPKGPALTLKGVDFLKSAEHRFYTQRFRHALFEAGWQSLLIAGVAFLSGVLYFKRKGTQGAQSTHLLGQVRLAPKALKNILKNLRRDSEFSIAGVPLVAGSEFQHLLLVGTTGTGKSLCMQELMDQVRAKGERALVYDIDGAFIPHYYRPGRDLLLNPLDARSMAWDIWKECQDRVDFESAAHALIASPLGHTDPFWINAARTVFTDAALTLKKQGKTEIACLLEPLFSKDLKALSALLKGTPAEALMAEQNEKTALSIKATLATACQSLSYLRQEGPVCSIKNWVADPQKDAWLFLASSTQTMDAFKPLLSLWLEVASKALLSLESTERRPLWLFLDELASLHRVPSLSQPLSRGRKYGAAIVASIQDIHQLYALYGKYEAETLSGLFNTRVFFRCQEPASAAWMSRAMGMFERLEQKESFSYGAHAMRDGIAMHEERLKEPLIKESEFLSLPDCEAFLKLAGNYPLTRLRFQCQERWALEPAFVPIPPDLPSDSEKEKSSETAVPQKKGGSTKNTAHKEKRSTRATTQTEADLKPVMPAAPAGPPQVRTQWPLKTCHSPQNDAPRER